MSHNQEPNHKRNKRGNGHDEIRLLRDQLNETKQELVRVMERSDERLSLLEQRIGSIESKNLDAALAAHKDEIQKEISDLKEFVTTSPVTVAQHEHSEIQALNTNTQALTTTLNRVEQDVEEQKKKFIKRIDRAGIIIGVLGGILAIGTAILTLPKTIKEFRSKPETQLVSSWPLEMSYDPMSKQIGFTFSVKVGNYGGRADTKYQLDQIAAEQGFFPRPKEGTMIKKG